MLIRRLTRRLVKTRWIGLRAIPKIRVVSPSFIISVRIGIIPPFILVRVKSINITLLQSRACISRMPL